MARVHKPYDSIYSTRGGYKTGLYTSPHLKDFRERIRINGEMIKKEIVINFIENNKEWFSQIGMSFLK